MTYNKALYKFICLLV